MVRAPQAAIDELLRRINAAAELAQGEKWAQALVAYQQVFDPMVSGDAMPSTPTLLADLTVRSAHVLCMLERVEEAVSTIAGVLVRLPPEESKAAYVLASAQAVILARANQREPMRAACFAALEIVDSRIDGDATLRVQLGNRVLRALVDSAHWALLLETARFFVAYGRQKNDCLVAMEGSWWVPHAYRGLGEVAKARDHARVIHEAMKRVSRPDAVLEWAQFLADCGAQRGWKFWK